MARSAEGIIDGRRVLADLKAMLKGRQQEICAHRWRQHPDKPGHSICDRCQAIDEPMTEEGRA